MRRALSRSLSVTGSSDAGVVVDVDDVDVEDGFGVPRGGGSVCA